MQHLLITIEGKDCKNCKHPKEYHNYCEDTHPKTFHKCLIGCKCNKFKQSPTTLIFNAEDFKGKELPKKGEVIEINCDGNYIIEDKKFRLTSDAVIKTRTKANTDFGRFVLESGKEKVVIAEGYYKM